MLLIYTCCVAATARLRSRVAGGCRGLLPGVLLATLLAPTTIAAAPLAQTLPEPAIPQAVLGSDWKVESVRGPDGPYAIYQVQLQPPGQNTFAVLEVGEA